MLQPPSSFSRARTLLQRAGNGTSALTGAGEAGFSTPDKPGPRPPDVAAVIDTALEEIASLDGVDLVAVHRESARSGVFGQWPDHLDDRLVGALERTGRARPYLHQAKAVEASLAGKDIVLSTATASGKSLCYQVPIVHDALAFPHARALMLFPTKALGRDQVEALRTLVAQLSGGHEVGSAPVGVAVYDGDTPPDERRAARRKAHAVATNPDMLHRGMLPNHERWAPFLSGLRTIVLDELHTYRGLFGSHVANVLRRLLRLCAHYGSRPRIVACSATIANPGELAQALCGRAFTVIDANSAPRGPRTWAIVNPQVVDPLTGVRRDYIKITRKVTTVLRRRGVQTLAFCRTRKAVELLTRYLQDDERAQAKAGKGGDPSAIRGYRGGYLPGLRREVEQALRDGSARVVAATNALELGIDIGGVDAVVLSGYPGTRAATMQRWGRAGRRGAPSLGILSLSSAPLDQFVAADPSFLWGKPPEHARVDPDNPEVLLPHLRCSAYELAFGPGRRWPGLAPDELDAGLEALAQQGALVSAGEGDARIFAGVGGDSPTESVDLRGSIEENFAVIDAKSQAVIAEVDFEDAPLYLHVGAIYGIEGRTHEVQRLDWDERKAYVRRVPADYYTEAVTKTRVRIVDPVVDPVADASRAPQADEGPQPDAPSSGQGFAHLVRSVPGFKKIRFGSHDNIGFGPIRLPDLELHTTASYWSYPKQSEVVCTDPVTRAATALGVAHAVHHVAAMVLMCDLGDLGHVVTAGHPGAWGPVLSPGRAPTVAALSAAAALPYIVLYDKHPGGAGLSTTAHAMGGDLFVRTASVVAGCHCERGCPTCMGPASDEAWQAQRGDVVAVLQAMARERSAAGPGPEQGLRPR